MAMESTWDVLTTLSPARRQLGIGRSLRWTIRGLGVGLLCAAILLLPAHLMPIALAVPLAVALVIAGAVAGIVAGIRRWPNPLEAARAVDRHFHLNDRTTTALELRESAQPVAALQRHDLSQRLEGLPLQESARGQISARELAACGLLALIVAALLLSGFPAQRVTGGASTADATRARHVAQKRVPQLIHRVNSNLPPPARQDPALRGLNLALARLQRTLMHTSTRAGALRAISATQAQLHQIARSLHPVSPSAVSQLARAMQAQMTPQQRAAASSQNRGAQAAAMAKALQSLAKSLQHMSAAQRAALAKALARAANSTSDSSMRGALQHAASSLGYNDPQSAAAALNGAAATLARSESARSAAGRLGAASSQLDSMKTDVSGVSASGSAGGTSSSSGGSGAADSASSGKGSGSGKGQGQGSGTGKGQGKGSGQGQGSGAGKGQGSGSGKGQGQGTGAGRGQGSGTGHGSGSGTGGRGGTGGHGIGGGRGGSGPQGQGQFGARVYIPGKSGKGQSIIQNGPSGAPVKGSSVPYGQVIGQYSQSAHAALDRSTLPPALQNYVRQYFSTLSH